MYFMASVGNSWRTRISSNLNSSSFFIVPTRSTCNKNSVEPKYQSTNVNTLQLVSLYLCSRTYAAGHMQQDICSRTRETCSRRKETQLTPTPRFRHSSSSCHSPRITASCMSSRNSLQANPMLMAVSSLSPVNTHNLIPARAKSCTERENTHTERKNRTQRTEHREQNTMATTPRPPRTPEHREKNIRGVLAHNRISTQSY
jgi:hypothetical protein